MLLLIIQKVKNFHSKQKNLVIYAFVFVGNENAHQRNAHLILEIVSLKFLKVNVVRPITSAVRNIIIFKCSSRSLNITIIGFQIIQLMIHIFYLVINLVSLIYFPTFSVMRRQEMKQAKNHHHLQIIVLRLIPPARKVYLMQLEKG